MRNLGATLILGLAFPVVAAATAPPDTGISWNLTAAEVTHSCAESLAGAKARVEAIDAQPLDKATFASGIGAIENVLADLNDALAVPTNLSEIAVAKDVRDASTTCQQDYAAYMVKISAEPAIYALAKAAEKQVTTQADRRLVTWYLEQGRRSGAGLDPTTRAKVTALFDQLNNLQIAFSRALAEEHRTIDISKEEAASLPKDFVATLKSNDHGYTVPVDESTAVTFLRNETSGPARKRFWVVYDNRGGQENVQRLTDAIAIRDQLAHLLGFNSWAAYRLDAKMAKTPERVNQFLVQLDDKLRPKANQEVATLSALKRRDGDTSPFEIWDFGHYKQVLKKERYDIDLELVRQYFPVDRVVPAMLAIYQKTLGVRFEEVPHAKTWAPGVTAYAIRDNASKQLLGWFYMDLYPRPGKYGHFASMPFVLGRLLPDGSMQKPVAAIVGNWPVSEPGKPSLLSHSDVIVFFHEFGHIMHMTLSKAPYETLYGTNVRQDFVEAPSQMLENWMWQPSVLKSVSSRVGTGEPLPDDLINKLIASKHATEGSDHLVDVFYSAYDMRLHESGPKVDPTKLWHATWRELTPFPTVEGTVPEASFGHLMQGYDAGYYGYVWSKVYAQDMYSAFSKEDADTAAVGMRYRKDILEPGGLEEPDVLLQRFLGRPTSYDAFYQDMGIVP
ncbi:M3 family metallopeptidase [Dyella sp. 20L07]|uniref:M3 family metallopeptidase n=1 Tax=Dyella sp. 20L07 TaxID=3384240 RepID=UPI003D2D6BE0